MYISQQHQNMSKSGTATWLDFMLGNLKRHNVSDEDINKLMQHIINEEPDSESVCQDVNHDKKQSNIHTQMRSIQVFESIRDYAKYSECM